MSDKMSSIGFRPRWSDSLIDKITTFSWKYMKTRLDYSNLEYDSLDESFRDQGALFTREIIVGCPCVVSH
jgi:hypothetical protein